MPVHWEKILQPHDMIGTNVHAKYVTHLSTIALYDPPPPTYMNTVINEYDICCRKKLTSVQ